MIVLCEVAMFFILLLVFMGALSIIIKGIAFSNNKKPKEPKEDSDNDIRD